MQLINTIAFYAPYRPPAAVAGGANNPSAEASLAQQVDGRAAGNAINAERRVASAQPTPTALSFSERKTSAQIIQQQIEAAARQSKNTDQTNAIQKPSDQDALKKTEDDAKNTNALNDLSPEEEKAVRELRARDREVRAHEQAHKAVGGRYAGAISYSFQEGPDGKQYAVGGEVPIDISPEATPEATIAKMRIVIAAALAPAEPSAADKAVAQTAKSQLVAASAQQQRETREENSTADKDETFSSVA